MAEQSLLTDEIRSHIGRTSEPRSARVTDEAVHRALEAWGGDRERHLQPGDVVPGYVLVGLAPEGEAVRLATLLPKSLLVSNEFSIERPILFGEELTAQSRVADISERLGGQFGHGLYVRTDMEFRDSTGALVAKTVSTLMYYDPAGARREEDGR